MQTAFFCQLFFRLLPADKKERIDPGTIKKAFVLNTIVIILILHEYGY